MLSFLILRKTFVPDFVSLEVVLVFSLPLEITATASDYEEHVNRQVCKYAADEGIAQIVHGCLGLASRSHIEQHIYGHHICTFVHDLKLLQ